MGICTFCADTIFRRDFHSGRKRKAHHGSFDTWKESVTASCMICTLLLEHIRTAVQDTDWKVVEESRAAAKEKAKKEALVQKAAQASLEGAKVNGEPASAAEIAAQKEQAADEKKEKQAKEDARIVKAKEQDRYIRQTAGEILLVEWLDAKASEVDIAWPVYETEVEDAGGQEAWLVKFKPVKTLRYAERDVQLPQQNFFAYAADYDGGLSERPVLEDKTDSPTTFAQIQDWAKRCKDHTACRKLHQKRGDNDWVPTRLIDVGDETTLPHLVETGNKVSGRFESYVTLSYKWGYPADYLLTEDKYSIFTEKMVFEGMPKTFKDAIDATRLLGIRYLWIDALCLLQQNADEWLREAPLMQEVYGNASLSLAAISGDNYEQGLFRTRSVEGAPPSSVQARSDGQEIDCVVVREDFWQGEVLSEPLYRRGWCLQERVLAPRVLHFQRRQVFWQCPSLTACEALPHGLSKIVEDERREELRWRELFHRPKRDKLSEFDEADLHEIWRLTVISYTRCNLTKTSDKIMAIASIAGKMQSDFMIPHNEKPEKQRKEGYYAGLWERLFVEQLAWKVVEWRSMPGPPAYRAPSWTWTSVDGVVNPPARTKHERMYTMDVIPGGINMQLVDPKTPTGLVHFGSLTVNTQKYHSMRFTEPEEGAREWDWTAHDGSRTAYCRLCLDQPIDDLHLTTEEEVKITTDTKQSLECRMIMLVYEQDIGARTISGFGLAVRSATSGIAKTYTRFGLIEFRNLTQDSWEAMQSFKEEKVLEPGEVAPSDNLPKDRYILTIL